MNDKKLIKSVIREFCKNHDKGRLISFEDLESYLPEEYLPVDIIDQIMIELENMGYPIDLEEVGGVQRRAHVEDPEGPPPTRLSLAEIGRKNSFSDNQEYQAFEGYYLHRIKLLENCLINQPELHSFFALSLKTRNELPNYPFEEQNQSLDFSKLQQAVLSKHSINWHPRYLGEFVSYLNLNKRILFAVELKETFELRKNIAERNLRLVVHLAKSYDYTNIPIHDLIQEGSRGLLKAIDRFDHRDGFKFASFATWWIKKCIFSAISAERSVRIPERIADTIKKINHAQEQSFAASGMELDLEGLAAKLKLPEHAIKEALEATSIIISLDTPLDFAGENTLGENLIDERSLAPDDEAFASIEKEEIKKVLDLLSEREQFIIKLRYGLEDGVQRSLGEVGEILNVSRERIRQIEKRILIKLRQVWEVENKTILDE